MFGWIGDLGIGAFMKDRVERASIAYRADLMTTRVLQERRDETKRVLSDLRASNARMADVLSSIRDRLGLDDGGSILDALDEAGPRLRSITLNGKPVKLPSGAPVDIVIST